jgi:hypothetical protein
MSEDFTGSGLKIEGHYENNRNAKSSALLKAIIPKAMAEQWGGVLDRDKG